LLQCTGLILHKASADLYQNKANAGIQIVQYPKGVETKATASTYR